MAPGWISYQKRLQYQHYDITEYITKDNRLEMPVGNGWYKGILSFDCKPNRYGEKVEAFAEIHIWYADGEKEVIATDESWGVRTGEIRYSEIYMGETRDSADPEKREGLPEKEDVLEVESGNYSYEYDTKTCLRELQYSFDNTLGEIMEVPVGMQMLEQMVPALMANPMIEYAKNMTLAEGISAAPEMRQVYEAVINTLNEQT